MPKRNAGMRFFSALALLALVVGVISIIRDYAVVSDVRKARAMLKTRKAGHAVRAIVHMNVRSGKKQQTWVERRLSYDVLVAVKRRNGPIEIIRLTENGNRTISRRFEVGRDRENGVNTPFSVRSPEGYEVLALRRVIREEDSFREVVYTPYSEALDNGVTRWRGRLFLEKTIRDAEDDLRLRGVRSRAYRDRSVADVVPTEIALTLAVIEHVDPGRFGRAMASPKPGLVKRLVDEVYVTVAMNGPDAYAYSVSDAGARGLFQFVRSTYDGVRREYPDAGLESDFVRGMHDPKNAAKASLLLFDSDLSRLSERRRERYRVHSEEMGEYLAVAYNWGSPRIIDAMRQCGQKWEERLPEETRTYLRKYRVVGNP
ncbi:MAG: lytic transglycosylase domain-containing protein [Candidatus Moranbacteria bacterium]|nr:lytic transglycosylase domain-containing protein [Candidatus Moranbacteria bacterium]